MPDGLLDVHGQPRRIVATICERHRAIQELHTAGRSLRGIGRDLDLDYYSVRRYARTANVGELLVKVTQRRTKLDDYKPCIYRRFTEGCHNARQLFREVREVREVRDQGFPGERTTVSRYVRLLREGMVTTPPPQHCPSPGEPCAGSRLIPSAYDPTKPSASRRSAQPAPNSMPRRSRPHLRQPHARAPRRRPSRLDCSHRSGSPTAPEPVRQRTPARPRRGHRRPIQLLELWPGGRPGHESQAPQARQVRPS